MRDRPDAAALLAIVADVLRDQVIPHLDGAAAYQARIAASLVAIVRRGEERGVADDEAELTRLRALLAREDGDLHALNVDLAARLRDGSIALEDAPVAEHLWATTLAKLAVDQPGFARYRALTGTAR